jgi:hypothetical protein
MENQEESEQIVEERKKKQIFLRNEILDFGYEASVFQDFLDTIKPDGKNHCKNYYIFIYQVGPTSISGP